MVLPFGRGAPIGPSVLSCLSLYIPSPAASPRYGSIRVTLHPCKFKKKQKKINKERTKEKNKEIKLSLMTTMCLVLVLRVGSQDLVDTDPTLSLELSAAVDHMRAAGPRL